MKIFIGFSKPTGTFEPFAWLIQWIEARPFDHAYVRLPEPMTGEYVIFQASKEMVNLYNKSIFSAANASLKEYELECSDEQYKTLWAFVIANLGVPYSLKEDLGILLMKIFRIKQPFNDGNSVEFCSKLGAIVCQMLGVKLPEDPGSIDPSALDLILSNAKIPCVSNPTF